MRKCFGQNSQLESGAELELVGLLDDRFFSSLIASFLVPSCEACGIVLDEKTSKYGDVFLLFNFNTLTCFNGAVSIDMQLSYALTSLRVS